VYVRNIPEEFRSNRKLEEYFRQCFSEDDSVLEARIRIEATNLGKKVLERDALLARLENAIAVMDATGDAPMHKSKVRGVGKVNSISTYKAELEELQKDLGARIASLEAKSFAGEGLANKSEDLKTFAEEGCIKTDDTKARGYLKLDEDEEVEFARTPYDDDLAGSRKELGKDGATPAGAGGGTVKGLASTATSILTSEDGAIYGAGFVTFSKLNTCHIARQTIHSHVPFSMEVLEAPDPEDVIWANVGKTHQQLQIGKLISTALTAVTCLFWTIPMAFFASLSSVDALKEQFDFLKDILENAPWLEPVLAQLAPLLVVIFSSLLNPILTFYSNLERPISIADMQGLLFSKLATFMIIQTFFVSAISGGLVEALADIAEDFTDVVPLLANSLPSRSTYFIQLLLVSTAVGVAFMESLRVVPVVISCIRGLIGPKLTEKQRNTPFLGLSPISIPPAFPHAVAMAQVVLYFMVFFVYSVVAPLTNYFLVLGFLFMCASK
jgi:hypothetical protein